MLRTNAYTHAGVHSQAYPQNRRHRQNKGYTDQLHRQLLPDCTIYKGQRTQQRA
ncbi:hypothetical protein D3C76_1444580 [compost metagenome]